MHSIMHKYISNKGSIKYKNSMTIRIKFKFSDQTIPLQATCHTNRQEWPNPLSP